MALLSAISNKVPEHPVVSPSSGVIFEKRLIEKHIIEYGGSFQRAGLGHWRCIDGNIPSLEIFPTLTMSDLILFGLGIYQIKQALSYYGEHIRPNGSFEVEVSSHVETTHISNISSSQETVIIRGRIRSRHRGRKMYYTYILINLRCDNWDDTISGYYCNCIVGKQTVGCCAHVMTIVWYLGWARHQENIEAPANFLDGILVRGDVEN